MGRFEVSKKDLTTIEKQLNRKIINEIKVVKRCSYGYPQVIKNYPLKDKKPFPTLQWLTCPFLIEQVSKLEEVHSIRLFEKELMEDKELQEKMIQAHNQEIKERLKILENEILSLPENMQKKLKTVGVGGIQNFKTIKCLHLHLASYLGGIDNPIGKKVWDTLNEKECSNCICGRE